jgi:hypothetical protein
LKIKRKAGEEKTEEFETNPFFILEPGNIKDLMKDCKFLLDRETLFSLFRKYIEYYKIDGEFDRSALKISIHSSETF